jgi:hypothetical protein
MSWVRVSDQQDVELKRARIKTHRKAEIKTKK